MTLRFCLLPLFQRKAIIMGTVTKIYNRLMNKKALINSSLYDVYGDKLIRFADHKCNYQNIETNNEGVLDIMLVYINPNITEIEIQNNCEEIEKNLNVNVDYVIYDNENDFVYCQSMINRFIN